MRTMIEELQALRPRLPDPKETPLINFMTAFFMPDGAMAFVPIERGHLLPGQVLWTPLCKLEQTTIGRMMRDAAKLEKCHIERHTSRALYCGLNSVFKKTCTKITKHQAFRLHATEGMLRAGIRSRLPRV